MSPLSVIPNLMYYPKLLDNIFTDSIKYLLNPDTLLNGVVILLLGIALVVSTIYLYLFNKKINFVYTNRIRKHLENWITQIIMEEAPEDIVISQKFHNLLNNRVARQFTINELILCKKNFSGTVAKNVIELYLQLGLKQYSLQKLASKKWHVQARGIQELYQMDQHDMLQDIYQYTNSKNEFVRMEAQTGLIHLSGADGLNFLDEISYPITEWQQLKLLEQLRLYPDKKDLSEKIPGWLGSSNDTVVIFALKLASEYQLYSVKKDVVNCLVHPHNAVRSQAIKALISLSDEKTPLILFGYFNKEEPENQLHILDALRTLATEEDTPGLLQLLDHENNMIKLKAAMILADVSPKGLDILERKGMEQPEPYQRIYRHVKTIR